MVQPLGVGAFVWSPGLSPYAFRFSVETHSDVAGYVSNWIEHRAVDRYEAVASTDGGLKAMLINWASLGVVEVLNRDPDSNFMSEFIVVEVFIDETTGRIKWAV